MQSHNSVSQARSCERLALLAGALPEEPLRRFYAELAQSEDGHGDDRGSSGRAEQTHP